MASSELAFPGLWHPGLHSDSHRLKRRVRQRRLGKFGQHMSGKRDFYRCEVSYICEMRERPIALTTRQERR